MEETKRTISHLFSANRKIRSAVCQRLSVIEKYRIKGLFEALYGAIFRLNQINSAKAGREGIIQKLLIFGSKNRSLIVRENRELKKWKTATALSLLVLLVLPYFALVDIGGTKVAEAASVGQLQGGLNGLNGQIDALNANLAQKRNEKASLQNQIDILNAQTQELQLQIQKTQDEIEKTQIEIDGTQTKINDAEAELQKQQEIIKEYLRTLYEDGRVSAAEVVASSDDFSTFLNQSEYLQTMQQNVQETAAKIARLKSELEGQKKALEGKKSDLSNMNKNSVVKRQI